MLVFNGKQFLVSCITAINPQAGGPSIFGHLWLLIQVCLQLYYIRKRDGSRIESDISALDCAAADNFFDRNKNAVNKKDTT